MVVKAGARITNCCEIVQRGQVIGGDDLGHDFATFERGPQEQLKFGPKQHSETTRSAQNCHGLYAAVLYAPTDVSGCRRCRIV